MLETPIWPHVGPRTYNCRVKNPSGTPTVTSHYVSHFVKQRCVMIQCYRGYHYICILVQFLESVKPLLSGHHRDLPKCPLNRGL